MKRKTEQPEPADRQPRAYCPACNAWVDVDENNTKVDHYLDQHLQALIDGRIEVQR